MTHPSPLPAGVPKPRSLRVLTDEMLDGVDVADLRCIVCCLAGGCGCKVMYLKPEGGLQPVCLKRLETARLEREGTGTPGGPSAKDMAPIHGEHAFGEPL